MAVELMQVATGKKMNVPVLVEDLALLKKLRKPNESSLTVTIHRILSEVSNEPAN